MVKLFLVFTYIWQEDGAIIYEVPESVQCKSGKGITWLVAVLGTASFFLSPQSANPQPNFNFFNPQPQVRNWTFKSLVRNRKSATTFRDS